MKITRIGLDIAKRVFQVHGVDESGRAKVTKKLSRSQVLQFFAQMPVCVVGIEACGGAHYWAREFGKLGHDVRLMAAQFVNSYRKSGKNDANDAEAICEAVGRPNMRFVALKTEEQQAVLMWHRASTLAVTNRTAQVNQIRGLLGEGCIVSKGIRPLRRELKATSTSPLASCQLLQQLSREISRLRMESGLPAVVESAPGHLSTSGETIRSHGCGVDSLWACYRA